MEQLKHIEASWRDPAVDLSDLLARVEYDRELLSDMLAVFRKEFPPIYTLLKDAAVRDEQTQVQISAHTLKGMLASLSFVRATDLAIRIDRMSRDGILNAADRELNVLGDEAAAAQACLEEILRGGAL